MNNNPLERFNRRMNEEIPSHPTMQVFVEGIKAGDGAMRTSWDDGKGSI